MDLYSLIRDVENFPKEGILFKDITTLLQNGEGLVASIDQICEKLEGVEFDTVVGPESRGFIFGVPTAYKMKKGFVPVRKKGKLPAETVSVDYALEYGVDVLQIHKDSIKKGQRVAIVDDLLATGGTIEAVAKLVEQVGGEVVSLDFAIELTELNGRDKLKGYEVMSLVQYEI